MDDGCCGDFDYSIKGRPEIVEGFGIAAKAGGFDWYFTERGQLNVLERFATEKDVVAFAYEHIRSNLTAWSHMVCFTSSKTKASMFVDLLKHWDIAYSQDDIPYGGPDDLRYRVFVYGCAVHLVRSLEIGMGG